MNPLTQRAFELRDLEVWCARNARYLVNAHDCYYYLRQLESMTVTDWHYYETEADFIRDTAVAWESCKGYVRAAFNFKIV